MTDWALTVSDDGTDSNHNKIHQDDTTTEIE
jgi:hypothetical protein